MKKWLVFQKVAELFSFRDFLLNLTVIELKLRYRHSVLGFLWTIINPLFYLLILALVFSRLIRFNLPQYTIFLFSGLVSWMMLQQTIVIGTASIVNNQHLIRKIYVPKMAFSLSNVLARYVDHVILVAILFIFMAIYRLPFRLALAFLPVSLLLHFFFTLGAVLLLSVVHIKIRDIQQIAAIIFQALFYACPIIYPLEALPERFRSLLLFNPLYYFIQVFRYPVYYGSLPPTSSLLIASLLTLLVFGGGLLLFCRKEKEFVFYLS